MEAAGPRSRSRGGEHGLVAGGGGGTRVCVHGVPTSGFLYRKLLPELASRGLEGITLDLPGLGLADRPADFDYSWSGFATWYLKAIDAAGIENFHLVRS